MSKHLDLGKLFQGVSTALVENQEVLNQADTLNHDHGDNMVEIFKVITEAMKKRQNADPSGQLAYASRMLRKQGESGSAQMYADGLSQAAEQFQGKSVTTDNAMELIQSLLGGGQSATQQAQATQAQTDLLGSLLGGMMGGESSSQPAQTSQVQPDLLGSLLGGLMGGAQSTSQPASQAPTDPLGSLLGGLLGGQSPQPQQDSSLDIGDLMSVGLAYLQAKQQGKGSMEAILNALIASSRGGQTPYRAQSSALVIKTLLQTIGSLSGK
jgi:hypothetical protein